MPDSQPRDLNRTTLSILFILVLIAASFMVFRPFLLATVWAAMIATSTWPLMRRLQSALGGRRGAAVAVMTIALLLVLIIPLSFAAVTIVQNADSVTVWLSSLHTRPLPQPPAWLSSIPLVGTEWTRIWSEAVAGGPESLLAKVGPYLGRLFDWFAGQLGGLGVMIFQFLLTVLITAIFYSNGEAAAKGVILFARRLAGAQGEQAVILAGQAVRGIALGVVVTATVQSLAAGIGLAIAGIPAAVLLTALIFVLCIAQLGPILIMLPCVGWLYWSGDSLWGSILLVWALLVGTMDNFLRPVLIRKGVDLPLLLIMSGVIGGLVAFGLIGIFVGPVVLAVNYMLLEDWVNRGATSAEADRESAFT